MLKGLIHKIVSKLFLKTKPVSTVFGLDRGTPIDRFYIEQFLQHNSARITGTCIEIAENTYTKKYGKSVSKSLILHVKQSNNTDIIGDLQTGEGIPTEIADCFIMTQTLSFIYDLKATIKHSLQMLKPGGCLLITNPGITQLSRYDYDRWGQYWSFTDMSIRKLFEEFVPAENIKTFTYGNVKTASCFLYGLSLEDLSLKDLQYNDPNYQLVIAAVITK